MQLIESTFNDCNYGSVVYNFTREVSISSFRKENKIVGKENKNKFLSKVKNIKRMKSPNHNFKHINSIDQTFCDFNTIISDESKDKIDLYFFIENNAIIDVKNQVKKNIQKVLVETEIFMKKKINDKRLNISDMVNIYFIKFDCHIKSILITKMYNYFENPEKLDQELAKNKLNKISINPAKFFYKKITSEIRPKENSSCFIIYLMNNYNFDLDIDEGIQNNIRKMKINHIYINFSELLDCKLFDEIVNINLNVDGS